MAGQGDAHGDVCPSKRPSSAPPTTQPPQKRIKTRPVPTHFLALQLSNHESVTRAMQTVQDTITQAAPSLQRACVQPSTAHVTLQVLALGSDDELIMQAIAALQSSSESLQRDGLREPCVLNLNGLGTFHNKVLHFKVTSTPPGHLTQLATCVRRCFHGVGQSHDRRPFAPHVTIMKTSKLPHRQHGVYIDPALYEEIQDVHTHLGPVEVDCVHLCSMARPSGSYYPVVASMCLDEGGEVFVEEPWRARWGAWDETCREEWEETMMAN